MGAPQVRSGGNGPHDVVSVFLERLNRRGLHTLV
jgi:hypothetical protein